MAQFEGTNVALFHHASRVEQRYLPPGTEVSVSTRTYEEEVGELPDYSVWENKTSRVDPADVTTPSQPEWLVDLSFPLERDDRSITLRLNGASLCVHHIEKVKVCSTPHRVTFFP